MRDGRTKDYGTISCQVCGKETKKNSASQKYCPDCSLEKDHERKKKWIRENQPSSDTAREQRKRHSDRRKKVGIEKSANNSMGIWWSAHESEADELINLIRVSVPFSYKYSKNAIWSMGNRRGHVFISKEVAALREELTWIIKSKNMTWYEGKVWVDIMVEKPDMKGDAINVVDLVCDAIKDAIGVDDRWFCIRRLDWLVVKKEPRLYVGIGQAINEHHRVCSTCGQILPLTAYGKNRGNRLGKSRDCLECSRMLDKARRERKKEAVATCE